MLSTPWPLALPFMDELTRVIQNIPSPIMLEVLQDSVEKFGFVSREVVHPSYSTLKTFVNDVKRSLIFQLEQFLLARELCEFNPIGSSSLLLEL